MRLTIHKAYLLRHAWLSRSTVSSLMTEVNYKAKLHQKSGYTLNYLLPLNIHQERWIHSPKIKKDAFSINGLSDNKLSSLPSTKTSLLKLIDLAKSESAYIAGAVGLLVITSSVTLAVPYCMGKIIDIIQSVSKDGSPQSTLQPIVAGLCALFVLGALANAGRIYLLQTSGERITKKLRQSVFSSIVAQDVSFFDKSETGELVNRLASDVPMVSASVTQNVSDGLRSLAQITTGVGMMYLMSPDLAYVILMVVPPVTVLAGFYGKYIQKITQKTQSSLARSTQFADERLSNIRTVQSFGKENLEASAYSAHVNSVLNLSIKEAIARAFFFGMTGFSGNMIMLLVLYNGGQMMHTGKISVGDLSAFLLYSAYVSFSIRGLSNFFTAMNKSIGASTRLWELIDRTPEISLQDGTVPDSTVINGDICFENVHFRYPLREKHVIFSNVNFHIKAGQITGPSGCGKSTVCSLLLRFYDPVKGVISLDGNNIKNFSPVWLRNQIGFVSQTPLLFSGSIKENILYGYRSTSPASEEVLRSVADQANALSFICELQNGFETLVGERGVTLSGGQQQRIAIARALIKDPKILMLDEATSALDVESEDLVRDALEKASIGRTTITIAHRLSTVRRADNIIVLDETGSVAESGDYKDLMLIDNGIFRRMVENQMLLFR